MLGSLGGLVGALVANPLTAAASALFAGEIALKEIIARAKQCIPAGCADLLPEPLNPEDRTIEGRVRPIIKQADRKIDRETDVRPSFARSMRPTASRAFAIKFAIATICYSARISRILLDTIASLHRAISSRPVTARPAERRSNAPSGSAI